MGATGPGTQVPQIRLVPI